MGTNSAGGGNKAEAWRVFDKRGSLESDLVEMEFPECYVSFNLYLNFLLESSSLTLVSLFIMENTQSSSIFFLLASYPLLDHLVHAN